MNLLNISSLPSFWGFRIPWTVNIDELRRQTQKWLHSWRTFKIRGAWWKDGRSSCYLLHGFSGFAPNWWGCVGFFFTLFFKVSLKSSYSSLLFFFFFFLYWQLEPQKKDLNLLWKCIFSCFKNFPFVTLATEPKSSTGRITFEHHCSTVGNHFSYIVTGSVRFGHHSIMFLITQGLVNSIRHLVWLPEITS